MRKQIKNTCLFLFLLVSSSGIGQICLQNYNITAYPPPSGGSYNAGETVTFCVEFDWDFGPTIEYLMGVEVSLGAGWDVSTLSPGGSSNNCYTIPPNTTTCSGNGSWSWVNSYMNTNTGATMGPGFLFDDMDINPTTSFGDNCASSNGTCLDDPCYTFCFTVTALPFGICNAGDDLSITINPLTDGEIGDDGDLTCSGDTNPFLANVSSCCNVSAGSDNCVTYCSDPGIGNINLNDLIIGENLGGTWYYDGMPLPDNEFNPAIDPEGTYIYVVTGMGGCTDQSNLIITINEFPYAGNDFSLEACIDFPVLTILNFFSPPPTDLGGSWLDPNDDPWDGTYDADVDISGDYLYITATTGICPGDTSIVSLSSVNYPDAGIDNVISLCSGVGPINLFDQLGGTPETGGSWTGPGVTTNGHLGTFDPSGEPGGIYIYSLANGTSSQCISTAEVEVIINNGANPGINTSQTLCSSSGLIDLLSLLDGSPDAGGVWTDPNSNVVPGGMLDPSGYLANTPYIFTYDLGAPPCEGSSELELIFSQSADAGISSGGSNDIAICGAGDVSVDVLINNGIGDYGITIQDENGNILFDQNNLASSSFTENIAVSSSGLLILSYFNDNGSTGCQGFINPSDTISVTVHQPPNGTIIASPDICLGDEITLDITLTGVGPFDIKIQENINPPIQYNNLGINESLSVTPSSSGTVNYTIIEIVDSNSPACLTNPLASSSIEVYDLPTAEIFGGGALCNGEDGEISIDITGIWADYNVWFTDGGTPFQFSNISDNDLIDLSVPAAVTYCIDSISPMAFPSCVSDVVIGCVDFVIASSPLISNVQVDCDPITEEGTVTFDVSDPDSDIFNSIGIDGAFGPSNFTSITYPNGTSLNFLIEDELGCASTSESVDINCSCTPSFPGTMQTLDTITTCSNLPLDVSGFFDNNEAILPGDILLYYLHDNSGNVLGNIETSSDNPLFFYSGNLTFGQVYYISPVTGLNNGGDINLNDPCLAVAEGIPVIFYEQPTATISTPNPSACEGSQAEIIIELTGGGPWQIFLNDPGGPVAGSPFAVTNSPFVYSTGSEGLYTLIGVENENCSGAISQAFADVTFFDLPELSISTSGIFCDNANNEITLDLEGVAPWNISYELDGVPQSSFIANGSPVTFPIDSEGQYVFTLLSDVLCQNIFFDTLDVSFNESPSAIISGGGSFCEGDSALISIEFTGGSGNYNFELFDGAGTIGPLINSSPNYNFYVYDSGNFQIISLSDDFCQGVFQGNALAQSFETPILDLTLSDELVCEGQESTLTFNFNQSGPFDIAFITNDDTTYIQINDGYQITYNPLDTIVFEVFDITNSSTGCFGSIGDLIVLNYLELPTSNAGPDVFICPGDTVQIGDVPIQGATYFWENNAGLSSTVTSNPLVSLENFTDDDIEVPYVIHTLLNGCESTDTIIVTVYDPPNVEFYWNPDPVLITEPVVNFINLSDNNLDFLWDIPTFGETNDPSPVVSFPGLVPLDYFVCLYGTDNNNCTSVYCTSVEISGDAIIYIPNSFTPDGDGVNDFFYPVVSNFDPDEYSFEIFDRWGHLVYQTNDPSAKWNGQGRNGAYFADSEVYIWMIKFKNEFNAEVIERKGHVTLIR